MLLPYVIVHNFFFENPTKRTSRGTGQCPSGCGYTYPNAWMPNICPNCGFKMGGGTSQKGRSQNQTHTRQAVFLQLNHHNSFSVQINSKYNRVFVVQSSSAFVCHFEECKKKRAVHVASGIPFSCEHCNLLKSFSSPTLATTLKVTNVITQLKECCWKLLNLLKILGMLLKFPSSYAIYHGASQVPSNLTGYCLVQKRDGLFRCTNKSC